MDKNESQWQVTLDQLRKSRTQVALVVTGGGAGALARCFRREGASNNFVEAVIPYSCEAMEAYLGSQPSDSSVSLAVAKQLARIAWQRANRFCGPQAEEGDDRTSDTVGIALTAALPTIPRRRGSDRIHAAMHTQSRGISWSVELPKQTFDRQSAETLADAIVLSALSECLSASSDEHVFDEFSVSIDRREFET